MLLYGDLITLEEIMNSFILKLFNELNKREVPYCHFKSNNNLIPAVNGVDDLDLLLGPGAVDTFNEVISRFGFRMAHDRGKEPTPYVYHYFGADPETGLLVHLHVYFKIVTGGSIFKNHWIRIEKMFLSNRRLDETTNVYIPCAEADCILFVIRKLIEQPSPVENFLFYRDHKNIMAELEWLLERLDQPMMLAMVEKWLPELSTKLFQNSLDVLANCGSLATRVKLGIEMRKCFDHKVRGAFGAEVLRSYQFLIAYIRGKLKVKRKNRFIFPGGLLVAFVGSEASGKSTLSKDVAIWLKERFDVAHIHVGKPPKNWRTRPLWILIGIYSSVKRLSPSSKNKNASTNATAALNLPHPVVCWLDSIDRREHLNKHFSMLMQGCTVITDRYPSAAIDGPRIKGESPITLLLSKFEQSNYESMPVPDVVIKAEAPLDVTLARNSLRLIPEPEAFVRARYELAKKISFEFSDMVTVDTTQEYTVTLAEVRRVVWCRSVLA
jgi:thymidylate kinase